MIFKNLRYLATRCRRIEAKIDPFARNGEHAGIPLNTREEEKEEEIPPNFSSIFKRETAIILRASLVHFVNLFSNASRHDLSFREHLGVV